MFVDPLNSIRYAKVDKTVTDFLKGLAREVVYEDNIEPTDLYANCLQQWILFTDILISFPNRDAVHNENQRRLERLPTDGHQYAAHDTGGTSEGSRPFPIAVVQKALETLNAPEVLVVKVSRYYSPLPCQGLTGIRKVPALCC